MNTATNRFMRRSEVEQKTGKSRSSIYEAISNGEFPKPVKIGSNAVAWIENEIQEWMDQRVKARNDRILSS